MIISNLEHAESISINVNEIKGGAAVSQIAFNVLGLGTNNSVSLGAVEVLAVSSPGVNISGLSGAFVAAAD